MRLRSDQPASPPSSAPGKPRCAISAWPELPSASNCAVSSHSSARRTSGGASGVAMRSESRVPRAVARPFSPSRSRELSLSSPERTTTEPSGWRISIRPSSIATEARASETAPAAPSVAGPAGTVGHGFGRDRCQRDPRPHQLDLARLEATGEEGAQARADEDLVEFEFQLRPLGSLPGIVDLQSLELEAQGKDRDRGRGRRGHQPGFRLEPVEGDLLPAFGRDQQRHRTPRSRRASPP